MVNEQLVEEEFVSRGFVILEPQSVSYHELAYLLAHVDILAGQSGAALTRAGICRPGTVFIQLCYEGFTDYIYHKVAAVSGFSKSYLYVEPEQQPAGMVIDGPAVLNALKVLALASQRQENNPKPLFRPLAFSAEMAERVLEAPEGMGFANLEQRRALLGYLVDLKLLHQAGVHTDELRFPLDPLADYLAALRQLELLEADPVAARNLWDVFLGELAKRSVEDRELMRGFLLALRDCCLELSKENHLAMPTDAPDRLSQLGFMDPEAERDGVALQAVTKWMWELGVPTGAGGACGG